VVDRLDDQTGSKVVANHESESVSALNYQKKLEPGWELNPRPTDCEGAEGCSSRCRWALWKAERQTQTRELRDGLLLIRAQVDDLLVCVERRR
jgi:hypothetical protein